MSIVVREARDSASKGIWLLNLPFGSVTLDSFYLSVYMSCYQINFLDMIIIDKNS